MTSGNDYVLQIKANQPKLLARLQEKHRADPCPCLCLCLCPATATATATAQVQERKSGCVVTWQTRVYPCHEAAIAAEWAGAAQAVVVVKTVQRAQHCTHSTRYYLTSLATASAAALGAGIRGHWGIENKLHRARDVQFGQDRNGIRHRQAAVNVALFNTLALNYLNLYVPQSASQAQLHFSQHFKDDLNPICRT